VNAIDINKWEVSCTKDQMDDSNQCYLVFAKTNPTFDFNTYISIASIPIFPKDGQEDIGLMIKAKEMDYRCKNAEIRIDKNEKHEFKCLTIVKKDDQIIQEMLKGETLFVRILDYRDRRETAKISLKKFTEQYELFMKQSEINILGGEK
jgi:ABC-type bacteriocin/lantibiotic exporter with double-glycine peptidase domain